MNKYSVQVRRTKVFNSQFSKAMSRRCRLIIVSPFISPIKPWTSVSDFARFFIGRHEERLTLVTRPPGLGPGLLSFQEADRLLRLGVAIKIRNQPTLHSKIYFFEYDQGDYTAFIGSANFTKGGFINNDETVVELRSAAQPSEVLEEIRRLTGLGAFPYEIWRTKQGKVADNKETP